MTFTQVEEDIIQEHISKEECRIRREIGHIYQTYCQYKEEAGLILGNWDIFVEICQPPSWLPPEFNTVLYAKSCYTENITDILGFIEWFIGHEMYDDGFPNLIYVKKSKDLPPLKNLSVEEATNALRDYHSAKYISCNLSDATDVLIIRDDEIDLDSLNLLQNKILVCYASLLDAVNFKKRRNDEFEAIRKKRYDANADSYNAMITSHADDTLKRLLCSFENIQNNSKEG